MRGIIAERVRALQEAATVTVFHGTTIALRLDKNLTQKQSKQLLVRT